MPEEKSKTFPEFFTPPDRGIEQPNNSAQEAEVVEQPITSESSEIKYLGSTEFDPINKSGPYQEHEPVIVPTAEEVEAEIPHEVAVSKAQEIKGILLDMLNDHSSKLPDTAVVMEDVLEYPEMTDHTEN